MNGTRVAGCMMPNNMYAVSCDGRILMLLSGKEIVFDVNRLTKFDFSHVFDNVDKSVQICPTKLRLKHDSRTVVRLKPLIDTGLEVWVDESFLKQFDGLKLYAYNEAKEVYIKDDYGHVVAVVMPVKVPKKEDLL